ncbi:keto-hydroxyglutarate-aldolase/keto-deoxy-phosphogluconate aldolase [Bacillus sp. NRRL B-14911]|uniref:Ketohydroxyglutarate aldolase n=1 Tax=Bacillus infantis NRRL B-14911 TaxID=1367477 RepID=U5LEQ6_9BACI|nr:MULTISPECIES: bifunctional 2-keto-4-hydroxyglutarate aldolase/2-keto-3-deoxy-6-phosphogluconate aldolase [Bacillus]AGX06329.1 ketohydroxyglutarate aldolase [Bacillus infantis NRRL B-14911]EAR68747.1 keto-hydroxyglutarate-aldolase/keto-deoxy-phosphogluconate aldolase [Bacillus sp. NRRL B-14911]MCA1033636.1 bifunctional 2-keto-4-hydroxyglutarate aldolase/2-keto-3-deoxy-6-phosphogluconate aldolase [Bacillus infantis]MDT0162079.1 bifunctional 2-keto-4-hydroxyglutarate aldolase/2-keto-3-deoxy-6-p
MNGKIEVLNKLADSKVVAVVRGRTAEEAIDISAAALEGGFQAIELTYTTPDVAKVFEAVRSEGGLIGAGTVLDPETARHAILNGASFIVSPNFNRDIAVICNRYSVPYLPGCMTITEIVSALESGADIVKLFPANRFDPSFIGAVNGPLPQVKIMPTGGVNLQNIGSWLKAGAVAAGIGSDLNKAYQSGGKAAVTELCRKYIAAAEESGQK